MNDFFTDLVVDDDQMLHTIAVHRSDSELTDDAASASIGTTQNPFTVLYESIPATVGDLDALEVEKWQRRGITATHEVYLKQDLLLRQDDIILLEGTPRFFRVTAIADILIQGIVWKVPVKELFKK